MRPEMSPAAVPQPLTEHISISPPYVSCIDVRSWTVTSIPRIKDAVAELATADVGKARQQASKVEKKPLGRVLVNIDVHELGPIELEVGLFPKRGRL